MFTINKDNVELRNIQEQVQKNKEDIARHWDVDRVLADFGIKVLGVVASEEALNALPTEDLVYGDGYLVGTAAPYVVYVWTRPNLNVGKPDPYWLEIGGISIVGPRGPVGPRGEKGAKGESTRWYSPNIPTQTQKPGDMVLQTNGDVLICNEDGTWSKTTNIKGPQGIQGPVGPVGPRGSVGSVGAKGDKGDTGGLVNIAGRLTSTSQLPTPTSLNNTTVAYLVNDDLYIQIGATPETAVWENIGPLNVATLVTTNGEYQNTWETNTKLDVYTPEEFAAPTVYAADYFSGGNYQAQIPLDSEHFGPIVRYFDSPYGMGILANGYLRSQTFEPSGLGADGCCVITSQNLMNWGLLNQSGEYIGPGTTTSGNGPYYHSITIGMPDNQGVNITFNITNHVRAEYTFLGGSIPTDLLGMIPINAPCIITDTNGGQRVGIIHSVNKSGPYEIKYKYSSEGTIHTLDVTPFPTISTDIVTDIGMDPSIMI